MAAEKNRSRAHGPAARALAFFENDGVTPDPGLLGRLRPAPLSPVLRAQVLTSLLSRDALALVTPEELQALAAHELGHEYLWNEYQAAMASKAHARIQELELVCDGIAVMSLAAVGVDPAHLGAAVSKMTRYNERLGATASADAYVSLGERLSFIDAMVARLEPGPTRETVSR